MAAAHDYPGELNNKKPRQTNHLEGSLGSESATTVAGRPTRARQLRKQGFTIAEIAHALDVSERSVFRYLG